jgi:hypothetical protein
LTWQNHISATDTIIDIQRSELPVAAAQGCSLNWAYNKHIPGNAFQFVDIQTDKQHKYCYHIRSCPANDLAKCSAWSNVANVRP